MVQLLTGPSRRLPDSSPLIGRSCRPPTQRRQTPPLRGAPPCQKPGHTSDQTSARSARPKVACGRVATLRVVPMNAQANSCPRVAFWAAKGCTSWAHNSAPREGATGPESTFVRGSPPRQINPRPTMCPAEQRSRRSADGVIVCQHCVRCGERRHAERDCKRTNVESKLRAA